MGGRDIFVTKLANTKWTWPENMGYPVNTTANDNYFTLIADGTRGYFSSDRKGGMGGRRHLLSRSARDLLPTFLLP